MLRRELLAASAAITAATVLGRVSVAQPTDGRVSRTATRIHGFPGDELDFQLMRSLGAASYGGAAAGEIFAARAAILDDDPYAWPGAFGALGARVAKLGEAALAAKRVVSARDHLLRASMYYRAAEYFSDPFGRDSREWGLASRSAFVAAAKLMTDRVEPVTVSFEGVPLPGYFMTPLGGARGGRTVVVLTGFDGTGEELYFEAAVAGLARGYNVFACEGPGQAGLMRFHPEVKFRPDYEKPIAAMLDAALVRRDVSADKLALYGISFGGYFVTRAGEHDRRIKALIVNSPIIDLFSFIAGFVGPQLANNPPPVTLADVDSVPDAQMPRTMKLAFKSACRRFGVDSFAGWMQRLKDFNAEAALSQINCPSLPMVGAGEGGEAIAQFERYAAKVSGPVTKRLFTTEEGADMHCQLGNLPLSCAVVYDWLDELFGI